MRLERSGHYAIPPGFIAAVVTWLEMHARPPRRHVEPPEGVRFCVDPAPDPRTYRELFAEIGRDWLWFSRLALSREELAALLADPRVEVGYVLAHGRRVGLVELDFRLEGQAELAFFGFVRGWTGRGLGRAAMEWALDRAFSRPIRRLFVHTCTLDHPAALPFYLKAGFRAFGRSVEVVPDPRLAGLLPREAAPHVPLVEPDGEGGLPP